MSVKQENRYRKWVLETGRAVTDRQREIEAATMERKRSMGRFSHEQHRHNERKREHRCHRA